MSQKLSLTRGIFCIYNKMWKFSEHTLKFCKYQKTSEAENSPASQSSIHLSSIRKMFPSVSMWYTKVSELEGIGKISII